VSEADIRSGVGEVMKAALVHDRRLFRLMQDHGEELVATKFSPSPVSDEVRKKEHGSIDPPPHAMKSASQSGDGGLV
jgi:3-dehydroquinate synthetase